MCVWEICHPERSKESREHPCKRICVCHRRYIVPIIYHVGMQCAAFFYGLLYHQVKERLLSGLFPFCQCKDRTIFSNACAKYWGQNPKVERVEWKSDFHRNEWNYFFRNSFTNPLNGRKIPQGKGYGMGLCQDTHRWQMAKMADGSLFKRKEK